MHCQFALSVYELPDCSFVWSFAGLYSYIAVYIINMHACTGAGYELSVLHRGPFMARGTNFGCQNRSGGTDFGSQN